MGYAESDTSAASAGRGFSLDEWVDRHRGYACGPERALMMALLFDGVQAYMNYVVADSPAARSRYLEAYNWVNREEGDYVFSFDNVCEALGIDPAALRYGVVNACYEQCVEFAKARRNF
jgi:hypothetical protein